MACEESVILKRLMCLENQQFDRNNLATKNDISLQQTQFQLRNNITKVFKEENSKNLLKRNIFQNTILNKNASIFMKKQQKQLMKYSDNYQSNRLEQEPFDDLLITPQEQKIYEQLDKLGVRLADPAELQHNYYQKTKNNFFSYDESRSDRFITSKLEERNFLISPSQTHSDCEVSSKGLDLRLEQSNILAKRSRFKNTIMKTCSSDSSDE